jgi:hypothetical protein
MKISRFGEARMVSILKVACAGNLRFAMIPGLVLALQSAAVLAETSTPNQSLLSSLRDSVCFAESFEDGRLWGPAVTRYILWHALTTPSQYNGTEKSGGYRFHWPKDPKWEEHEAVGKLPTCRTTQPSPRAGVIQGGAGVTAVHGAFHDGTPHREDEVGVTGGGKCQ